MAAEAQVAAGADVPLDVLGRPLADWGRRITAILIDAVVVGVPLYLAVNVGLGLQAHAAVSGPAGHSVASVSGVGAAAAGAALDVAAYLVYSTLMEAGASGQTVGKRLTGIAVRDAFTGGPIGWRRALVRRFVYVVLWLAFLVPGLLDAMSATWNPSRQSWHDQMADTVVVQAVQDRRAERDSGS